MYLLLFNVLNIAAPGILTFILYVLPEKYGKKNKYLMALFGLLIGHFLLIHFQITGILTIYDFAPLVLSIILCYGPVFFFYIKSFYELKNKYVIWQILLPLTGLYLMYGMMFLGIDIVPQWFLSTYYMSFLLIYFTKSIIIIKKHINNNEFKWMQTCTIWFSGLILFFAFEAIWINIDVESVIAAGIYTTLALNIFCFSFSLIVIYQIIRTPGIFANIRISKTYKNESHGINKLELKLITDFIITQKQFQNPDLNRIHISEKTGLSVHRISELVNKKFKKNFNEWINELRIEMAKQLLSTTELSIKEIYFESGFNSKSAFNTAFKKQTGLTPSSFKKEIKSLSEELI